MRSLFYRCSVLLAVFCFALIGINSNAQVANNTALVGTVLDPEGHPVAGAKVTATEESKRTTYSGITNNDGYYAITFITPGTYDLTVELSGFTSITKTGALVPVDQAIRTDFKLQVGSATTSVTVSASTPPISTDDATLGETFETKAVQDLPLMGHNAIELATTASNVILGPTSSYSGVPPGDDFIGAGQREIQNSLSLDGVSIMNNLITLAAARPSSDMISEVQMQSGNYPAQYGSYLGVHVNMVSKSGTNDLHGSLYDYIQNTALNARDFTYTPTPGQAAPTLHYNQYGFAVGGPVYIPKLYNGRNRTFFFSAWEKLDQKQASSSGTSSALTPAMMNGDFSALLTADGGGQQLIDPYTGQPYPNNQIPANELNTAAAQISKKLEAYMVAPNLPGPVNNINLTVPNTLSITQALERIDENIGEKVRLFVRYHWQNITFASGSLFPTSSSYGPTNTRNTAIGYTHIITPNLINDFHIGLNTVISNNLNYFAVNNLKGAGTALGIPGFDSDTQFNNPGIPNVNIDTFTGLGNDSSNWYQGDRTIDGYDQISYTFGKHNIMVGAELRKITINRQAANDPRGVFDFNGSGPVQDDNGNTLGYISSGNGGADFVLGLAADSTTPIFPVNGSIGEWRDGFFALDNWQVSPKLTLNYGVRYELPTVPYSLNGYARILNPQETALIPDSNATTPGTFKPTPGFKFNNPNHNDWAPRLGFAYRVTDRTVLRGGFGLYYNANQLNTYTLSTQNYPLSATVSYNSTYNNQLSFSNPTPGAADAGPTPGTPGSYVNAVTVNPYLPTQQLYQWNLTWGQSLWTGSGFELQYLGSHSLHLDRDFFDNQPLHPSVDTDINSRRPNQAFGRIRKIQNDEYAHYNGLTAILRQRAYHGVSANLSYTWAHDLDLTDSSNSGGGTTMDQYDISRDYGNTDWDIRSRFVGTVSYDLPKFQNLNPLARNILGGWQTNAIVTLQTGKPFNVNLGFDNANVGLPRGNTQRPNWTYKATTHCSISNYIHQTTCIDGAAYSIPDPGTYGNARRNQLHGPGLNNVDFSLNKEINIWERLKFQIRGEASNVFNHPSASNPNSEIEQGFIPGDTTSYINTNFGTVTGTQSSARVIQVAGKLIF